MTTEELCRLLGEFCLRTPTVRGRQVRDCEIILALRSDGSGVLEATVESTDHVPGPDHPGVIGAMLDEPSEVVAEFSDLAALEKVLRGTVAPKWLFFGEIDGGSETA